MLRAAPSRAIVCRVQVRRDPKNKKYTEALETLEATLAWLKEGKDVRFIVDEHKWGYKEIDVINELMLLTAKPASTRHSDAPCAPLSGHRRHALCARPLPPSRRVLPAFRARAPVLSPHALPSPLFPRFACSLPRPVPSPQCT